jgi:hypothetical protein
MILDLHNAPKFHLKRVEINLDPHLVPNWGEKGIEWGYPDPMLLRFGHRVEREVTVIPLQPYETTHIVVDIPVIGGVWHSK